MERKLTMTEVLDALDEVDATGSARISAGGLFTRREENADWLYIGDVYDSTAAQSWINEYFSGETNQ